MDNQKGMSQVEKNPPHNNTKPSNKPSIYGITCPKCQNTDLTVLGTEGARKAAMKIGVAAGAFGAIGAAVAASSSQPDLTAFKALEFKCRSCKKKFTAPAFEAAPEEVLDVPCTVNFIRLKAFYGWAVAQNVWINGVRVGDVKNGKTLTFKVFTKHNTVFVTDMYGVAFKGDFKFEATEGGSVDIRFKGKKFIN